MSHITSVAGAVFDVITLNQALKALDLEYKCNNKVKIEDPCSADLIIKSKTGDLGIKQTAKGEFNFLIDKKHSKEQNELVGQIKQKYNYLKVMDELKKKGYRLENETGSLGKEIKLKFTKWG